MAAGGGWRGASAPAGAVPGGLLFMAASAFWFSLMSLLVKVAGQRLPFQEVVLARAAISLALSWIALRRAGRRPWGRRRRLLVLRGMLGFLALSCFYYALVHLPLADATVIQYTNPVFTAVIAAFALRERLGGREAACVGASLVGVVLVARPAFLFGGGGLEPAAVVVALVGAVLSAAAYVTVRKLGETEHPLVIVFYFALVSTVGALPATVPVALWPTTPEWLILLGVGVTTQLGQVYLTRGLQRERAGRAMAVAYLQIVFAGAWGILFFRELPDAWGLAGAALVVGSIALLGSGRSGPEKGGAPREAGPAR